MKRWIWVLVLLLAFTSGRECLLPAVAACPYEIQEQPAAAISAKDLVPVADMHLEDMPVVVHSTLQGSGPAGVMLLPYLLPVCSCTASKLNLIANRLRTYFRFPQLAFLYPRHGFW